MLVRCGSVANSPFRVSALVSSINHALNSSVVVALRSVYVHYIQLQPGAELSEEEEKLVLDVLKYGNQPSPDDVLDNALVNAVENGNSNVPESCYILRVVPMPGTESPWSSKATNIFANCGFSKVKRVERGTAFLIQVRKFFPFAEHLKSGPFLDVFHDRMTQKVNLEPVDEESLFGHEKPRPLVTVSRSGIAEANKTMGLALDQAEIDYLNSSFPHRDPTDVELFMFAQVNSEHCRHKIFNADWKIDGESKPKSLFKLIRATHEAAPEHTVSAYSDNSAVLEGSNAFYWSPDPHSNLYDLQAEAVPYLAKVETHNHPTAISPFPGAATGSGGEIRDEGATGRGSRPKAGLSGFVTSDLHIPEFEQSWELNVGKPHHIASPLDIMIHAPLGSASYNNEFGRPAISGFFRTLTTNVSLGPSGKSELRGYHKPIMLAGGMGSVRPRFALKDKPVPAGAKLIVLGGPAMLIGLGGGAASSLAASEGKSDLDFASVQRGNPEMQRRAQMVIDTCVALGAANPILTIHDVGAGGLSNAFTELVHDSGLGANLEIREVPCLDSGMSPMEIWCCEAQERYVLAVMPDDLDEFTAICDRERAVYGVVGEATAEKRLLVTDRLQNNNPVDLDMGVLFGKAPRISRSSMTRHLKLGPVKLPSDFDEVLSRVLLLPSVGSKSFLITIGDRSVSGLVARDQMVGPWQVPVADVGVTASSYGADVRTGEAMACGERPAIAIVDPAAASRVSVAESLLNLAAADIRPEAKLSANWMASPAHDCDGAGLYDAVHALSEICVALGVSVPVGKDSMSMSMRWDAGKKQVTAPVSVVVTAFAPVIDILNTWTPQLERDDGSELIWVTTKPSNTARLGATAAAQVYQLVGDDITDVNVTVLKSLLSAICELHKGDNVLAYHDIGDGGLIVTLLEMAFAGRTGLVVSKDLSPSDLFEECPGAVFQVRNAETLIKVLEQHGVPTANIRRVGRPDLGKDHVVRIGSLLTSTRAKLQNQWSQVSYHMQRLRDHPKCADQELGNIADCADPGLTYKLTFNTAIPQSVGTARPRVAVLREQGINGHMEMAWAWQQAGFDAIDVHMSDLLAERVHLRDFSGIAACGGFSYGDVLGAANGWATSVLYNESLRNQFYEFFRNPKTFSFGVCNGCQFLSKLKSIIPGCEDWPSFEKNVSEQFEARTSMVEIMEDESSSAPSVFLHSMRGSRMPIAVAHGEGRVGFSSQEQFSRFTQNHLAVVRFVDNYGKPTERYPFNPNGSLHGICGIRSPDGRVFAMMPHPERNVMLSGQSWRPSSLDAAPWLRLFVNARLWIDSQ